MMAGNRCLEKDTLSTCNVCGMYCGTKKLKDGLCSRCKKEEVFL